MLIAAKVYKNLQISILKRIKDTYSPFTPSFMSADMQKLQQQWHSSHKEKKLLIILAAVTLVSVFLPWVSLSIPSLGGVNLGNVNGFRSFGLLTFLASLGYLLWQVLPMIGTQVPQITSAPKTTEKILGVVMLAGPVLWLLRMGFEFGLVGLGLWLALIASGVFMYKTF